MEDETIIALYFARDPDAIERTGEKYGERLLGLSRRLLVILQDAEECVNDTYLGAWNSIPPQRPVYFFAYLAKLCRNLACNRLDRRNAKKRQAEIVELTAELALCVPDPAAEREREAAELAESLNAFLRTLPKETRQIFLRRYWYAESVREIAERFGFGESRVKTLLFRTRQKLREYLDKEEIAQ